MLRSVVVCACLTALSLSIGTAAASASAPAMPPKGKVLLGVGGMADSPSAFSSLTGVRHDLRMVFVGWGQGVSWGKRMDDWLSDSRAGDYRMMFHLGTDRMGHEAITPLQIARGAGDGYLLAVSRSLNASGQYAYVRPMAEMNGHWNLYSAFNADGSRRNAAHSTASYRNAFRRIALVMHGGDVAAIDRALRVYHLPRLRTSATQLERSGKVAVVWNPQGEGNPNVRGNQPRDYYPGTHFVDYVANDLYSIRLRPNWRAQNALYAMFPRKPFMVAEWAPWGTDDARYVDQMFAWVAKHPRTKALVYFNGNGAATFRLSRKARSVARYRRDARAVRFRCAICGAVT